MWGARYWGRRYWGARYFGKRGFSVDGGYWGGRYWSTRYWGLRYWGKNTTSNPFDLEQTNVPALTGVLLLASGDVQFPTAFDVAQTNSVLLSGTFGITGDVGIEGEPWDLASPLEITPLVGTLTVAGDIEIVTTAAGGYWGHRYWGSRYWGPRYWGRSPNFDLEQTADIALTGTLGIAGQIQVPVDITPTNTLAMLGTLTISGNPTANTIFNLVPTATIALSATLGISGNIGFGSRGVPSRTLNVRTAGRALKSGPGERTLNVAPSSRRR